MGINVAIDGPSGAGKSSIAKKVASMLKYVYVDTGAMYRAIALYVIRSNVDFEDKDAILPLLENISIKLVYVDGNQRVMLNEEDVSELIRTPEVSMGASNVSQIPQVREFLLDLQRDIARDNNVIMDGRDIGTVILPNAQVKIFLTASAEERASRRYKELVGKGEECTYEEVLQSVKQRDFNDINREISPLKKAEDAVEIETTNLGFEQSVELVCGTIKNKLEIKEDNVKKERKSKVLAEVRPITKTHKLGKFHMFWYTVLRYIVLGIYHIYYNISYEGLENVPKDGGNIFASNHRSYQDPVFIALHTRVPLSYMAKIELFHKNWAFSLLIKAFGAFPVVRGKGDSQVIDVSIEKLEKGRNLTIFPEGTRSKDGKVGKGKTGVALVAAVAQTNIIPVGINFENKLKFRSKVVVRYGKVITPAQLGVVSADSKSLKILKGKIMSDITDLVY